MKLRWLILAIGLGTALLSYGTGTTGAWLSDRETSNSNAFQAWTSIVWTQTTQADFNAGVLSSVDTSTSPGNVLLAALVPINVDAVDNFESNGWSGGSGWLAGWAHQGTASVTNSGTPHGGSYHMLLQSSDGYAERTVNLAGTTTVRLQFWAKAYSFESGETAICRINDGTGWTTVHTWTSSDSDNTYHSFDIDLSSYAKPSTFYVAFAAHMSSSSDYFYVDDLELTASNSYQGWYNISWPYRRQITIDHTKVTNVSNPSTTYANFPVLVYATGLSNINANGTDIRFTASDGTTELPREIESYSSGTLNAWVKFTLTKDAGDATNDTIYMYYGNTSATEPAAASTYGSQNVWDTGYKGVWHLKEATGGSGAIKDSTLNNNHGTDTNAPTLGVAGKIGNAINFDGTNDYINVGDSASLDLNANLTVELWFSPTQDFTANADYLQGLIDKGEYKLFLDKSDGKLKAEVTDGSTTWTSSYDGSHEKIESLAVYNGKLYAGQGYGTGAGDVLVYDGSTWTTSYNGAQEEIMALAVYNGKLYAGQGYGTGDGDVLVFDGSTWTTSYNGAQEKILSLAVYNGKLYAGQGNGTGDGDVLVFDGSTWTTSYNGAKSGIEAFAVYNGKLYAGQGYNAGDGDVLMFDGSTWTTSYDGTNDDISALAVYNGKLYAGQGYSTAGDGDIYVLNAGGQVTSTATSWSSTFHSVTATKNSTTLTLYVDGAQQASVTVSASLETNALSLLIGKLYGTRGTGNGEGLYKGIIDEARISNTARSAQWIQTEYNNQNAPDTFCLTGQQTALYVSSGTLASQVLDTGRASDRWDGLFWTRTLPTGTGITFEVRESNAAFAKDAGSPLWTAVGGTSPVTTGLPSGRYMQWRATLTTSDQTATPTLSEVLVYHY